MSKAFTRESDEAVEAPLAPRRSPLPFGVKNLITPGGLRRIEGELAELCRDRPRLRDSETLAALLAIDRRIAQLQEVLRTAVEVPPPAREDTLVRFGARVQVRELNGGVISYRIVGVDEADFEENAISWRSPLAAALLNKRIGERTRVRLPGGEQWLEILGFSYH